jgi:hypothetical protein
VQQTTCCAANNLLCCSMTPRSTVLLYISSHCLYLSSPYRSQWRGSTKSHFTFVHKHMSTQLLHMISWLNCCTWLPYCFT